MIYDTIRATGEGRIVQRSRQGRGDIPFITVLKAEGEQAFTVKAARGDFRVDPHETSERKEGE